MQTIHPSPRLALVVVALALATAPAGCRSPSGGTVNPFLAPDRVPPPATRVLAPGQAQPYYPGDPLPVMQSSAAPHSASAVALAWTPPQNQSMASGEMIGPVTGPVAPAGALVFSGEPTVAIPADEDTLRFAAPAEPAAPEPAPFTPVAPIPIQLAGQAAPLIVPPPQTLQASHAEAAAIQMAPAPQTPWRAPQIPQQTLPPPPSIAQQIFAQPLVQSPPTVALNSMDVRLRAVASPLPETLPSTPRIRFPGQPAPQSANLDGFRPRTSMR